MIPSSPSFPKIAWTIRNKKNTCFSYGFHCVYKLFKKKYFVPNQKLSNTTYDVISGHWEDSDGVYGRLVISIISFLHILERVELVLWKKKNLIPPYADPTQSIFSRPHQIMTNMTLVYMWRYRWPTKWLCSGWSGASCSCWMHLNVRCRYTWHPCWLRPGCMRRRWPPIVWSPSWTTYAYSRSRWKSSKRCTWTRPSTAA